MAHFFKTIQAKLILISFNFSLLIAFLGFLFFFNVDYISENLRLHIKEELPVTYVTQKALSALERTNGYLGAALSVESFNDLDVVQTAEANFNRAVLEYKMNTLALIWGSESESFSQISAGLLREHWERTEEAELYQVPAASENTAKITGEAHLYFRSMERKIREAFVLQKKIIRLQVEGEPVQQYETQIQDLLVEIEVQRKKVSERMQALVNENITESQERLTIIERNTALSKQITIISIIVGSVFVLSLVNIFAYFVIILPLTILRKGSAEIAAGNFDYQVAIKSQDEIGALSQDFNSMATELKKRDEQLKGVLDSLTVLNKALRHDLLNDLTVVQGNIETLRDNPKKKDKQQLLTDIDEAVERSITFINSMKGLEISLSVNKALEKIDVGTYVKTVARKIDDLRVIINGSGVIFGDSAFESVLTNLFRNAQIHGNADQVEVSIKKGKKYVTVEVEDNGSGIPDEIFDTLFDEGFVYGKKGNTGLGLYITEKTVERYKGKITAKNSESGGAVFTMTFPNPDIKK